MPRFIRDNRIPLAAVLAITLLVLLANSERPARASNLSTGYKYEVDLGVQVITPTASTALTIPAGTRHAEFLVDSANPVLVRWNGSLPVEATAFKWPAGHIRKESNDGQKLAGLRLLDSSAGASTVRVIYFGDRRDQ